MKRSAAFLLTLLFVISACNTPVAAPTQSQSTNDSPGNAETECIAPASPFSYPVNQKHAVPSPTKRLPPPPWQVEASLPEGPSVGHALDWISLARTTNGYSEVWLKRTLDSGEGKPEVQFWVYQAKTKKWNDIDHSIDGKRTSGASIHLGSNGTLWVESSSSGGGYFTAFNDQEQQFAFPAKHHQLPQGIRLPDATGSFWILAPKDGIYHFDPLNHILSKELSFPELETGSSLYGSMADIAPDGSIYFLSVTGESQTRLLHFVPKTERLEEVPYHDYLEETAFSLFVDRAGRVWMNDIGWMDPDNTWNRIVRSPLFITDQAESAWNFVWMRPDILQESEDGRLWFQSANGLTWMDPQKGQWCWFTTEVSNLVEDGQGNLWMISGGKLYQHSQTP